MSKLQSRLARIEDRLQQRAASSLWDLSLLSDEDLERLEFILSLTRDLGVNLAGVEVVMILRDRMEKMQDEMQRLIDGYEGKLRAAGIEVERPSFEKPLKPTGLVKLSPQGLRKRD